MKLKEILLAVAIAILTFLVAFYAVNTVFPKPQYEDYCNTSYYDKPYLDRGTCAAVCVPLYEIRGDKCVYNECGSGCGADEIASFNTAEECEQGIYDYQCSARYDVVLKERSRKVFFVALPLGIIIIAVGAFVFGLEAVGTGLMAGGVATLIYGSGAYWPYSENWIRLLISFVGLAVLIWFAYFFNKKMKKKRF